MRMLFSSHVGEREVPTGSQAPRKPFMLQWIPSRLPVGLIHPEVKNLEGERRGLREGSLAPQSAQPEDSPVGNTVTTFVQ